MVPISHRVRQQHPELFTEAILHGRQGDRDLSLADSAGLESRCETIEESTAHQWSRSARKERRSCNRKPPFTQFGSGVTLTPRCHAGSGWSSGSSASRNTSYICYYTSTTYWARCTC